MKHVYRLEEWLFAIHFYIPTGFFWCICFNISVFEIPIPILRSIKALEFLALNFQKIIVKKSFQWMEAVSFLLRAPEGSRTEKERSIIWRLLEFLLHLLSIDGRRGRRPYTENCTLGTKEKLWSHARVHVRIHMQDFPLSLPFLDAINYHSSSGARRMGDCKAHLLCLRKFRKRFRRERRDGGDSDLLLMRRILVSTWADP